MPILKLPNVDSYFIFRKWENIFSSVLSYFFLAFFPNCIEAQPNIQKDALYEAFDVLVGEEVSGLYNGIQYANEYILL